MKPLLLVLIPMSGSCLARLNSEFDVRHAPTEQTRGAVVSEHGTRIEAILTNGTTGLRADEVSAMPRLSLVCTLGAGYENVAVVDARARGVVLANGAGTNDDCVADHALALLLATVRMIPQLDRLCRQGVWRDALPSLPPQLAGKRIGILGMGTIGRKIARRAGAFDLTVGYHNRSRRTDASFRYFHTLRELAEWSDFLVVAAPGGAGTKHLVDAPVLRALGSNGYLVNIARGSIVDTEALAQALRAGEVGGAGLDVYESEPLPPAALTKLPNVVLTPHIAGSSPETKKATLDCFLDNARLHFSGQPVRTPIPVI